MPVTAWRIIAAQTIDARIAELIDSKAGLAARALDGSDEVVLLDRRAARGARRAAHRRALGVAGPPSSRRAGEGRPGTGVAAIPTKLIDMVRDALGHRSGDARVRGPAALRQRAVSAPALS